MAKLAKLTWENNRSRLFNTLIPQASVMVPQYDQVTELQRVNKVR